MAELDEFLNIDDQKELFNEFVTPEVEIQLRGRSKLWDMIRKDWKHTDVEGLYAKQKVALEAPQSTGASYDDKYPDSQIVDVNKVILYIKRAEMFSLGFSGFALEAARRDGVTMPPWELEHDLLFLTMSEDLSRQLMMDGSGRLCQLVTCGADPTTDVKNAFFADATKFLKKKRRLEVHTLADIIGAGKAVSSYDGTLKVASVTDADTFELNANCSVSGDVDDYYFNHKAYAVAEGAGLGEMMGLMGIISDANPPQPNSTYGLQQLKVADYPEWVAKVDSNGGTPRDFEESLFIKMLNHISSFADTDVILVSEGVYNSYYKILRQFVSLPNAKALWGGWDGIAFIYNGKRIPMVSDKFVPDGCALFISQKDLIIHVMTPDILTWESGFGSGGGYLQKVADYNRYKAEGHIFANMGTHRRNAFGIIKDIKEA